MSLRDNGRSSPEELKEIREIAYRIREARERLMPLVNAQISLFCGLADGRIPRVDFERAYHYER